VSSFFDTHIVRFDAPEKIGSSPQGALGRHRISRAREGATIAEVVLQATREDVVLRDGSTLRLRPTSAEDGGALVSFFAHLSPESLYLRFQGAVRVDEHVVAPFLGGDGTESLSLVGELTGDAGEERILGIGTYVRLRDPARAEVAFAVADEFQHRGIGSRLLERLAVRRSGSPRTLCPRTREASRGSPGALARPTATTPRSPHRSPPSSSRGRSL
jgi:GNAT superfamily N-acetyltransferase